MPVPPFRKHVPGKRSNASCSYSKTVTVSTALTNQTNIPSWRKDQLTVDLHQLQVAFWQRGRGHTSTKRGPQEERNEHDHIKFLYVDRP